MSVHIYRSTDTDAPSLTRAAGSLVALLKACLVDGYSSGGTAKAAAGWTAVTGAGETANDVLLRNSSTAGSGRYFRIKDDGYPENTTSSPVYYLATITGAQSYVSINSLQSPFPRTISGENLHSNTFYGSTFYKTHHSASTSVGRPWIVIADETVCYLIIQPSVSSGDWDATKPTWVNGFGDISRLANINNYPEAFVLGVGFLDGSNEISNFYSYVTVLNCNQKPGYLEFPLTGGSASTLFYTLASRVGYGAIGVNNLYADGFVGKGYLYSNGSPITGGAVFEPIYVADDTNNTVRSTGTKHTNYELEKFAKFKGVFRCLHLVGEHDYRIGNVFDTVSVGGRDYLILTACGNDSLTSFNNIPLAIDITGPW